MATIILRDTGSIPSPGSSYKGTPLTNLEVDNNFSNINITLGTLSNLTTSANANLVSAINSITFTPGTVGNVLTSTGSTFTSQSLPASGLSYVEKSANYTVTNNQGVLSNTAAGAFTITLPASPTVGNQVVIADSFGSWSSNNLTIGRNGSTIENSASDLICDITGASVQLVYTGNTWDVFATVGGSGGDVVTLTGAQTLTNKTLTSPIITGTGAIAAATGAFTTLTTSSTVTHNGGTANGVAFLNASKVLTTGSALTFNGTSLSIGVSPSSPASKLNVSVGNVSTLGAPASMGLSIDSNDNNIVVGNLSQIGLGLRNDFQPSYIAHVVTSAAGYSNGSLVFGTRSVTTDTAPSERLRITSAGDVGIGTSSPLSRLQTTGTGAGTLGLVSSAALRIAPAQTGSTDQIVFGYAESGGSASGAIGYIATDVSNYQKGALFFATRDVTTNTAPSERLRITSAGDVGIGTSSPTTFSGYTVLEVKGLTEGGRISANYNNSVYMTMFANSNDLGHVGTNSAHPAVFITSGTERARITSNGNLLVAKTTPNLAVAGLQFIGGAGGSSITSDNTTPLALNRLTSDGDALTFFRATSQVGSVSVTTSATAYNTSSDYRLKNTIALMTGALAKVALLKPVTYKWNADGSNGEGFIAHELAEVCPSAVTGAKDAVDADGNPKYQGVDTSFLVATLTAAIQEQQAIIQSLKARLDAANL